MRYDPSPEEIIEACREIRSQWDDREFARRAGVTEEYRHWHPPGPLKLCLTERDGVLSSSD